MQAIRTTSGNGYVTANCQAGSIRIKNDPTLRNNAAANHRKAAEALIAKLGWNEEGYGFLVTGCLPDNSFAHVLTGRDGRGDV